MISVASSCFCSASIEKSYSQWVEWFLANAVFKPLFMRIWAGVFHGPLANGFVGRYGSERVKRILLKKLWRLS